MAGDVDAADIELIDTPKVKEAKRMPQPPREAEPEASHGIAQHTDSAATPTKVDDLDRDLDHDLVAPEELDAVGRDEQPAEPTKGRLPGPPLVLTGGVVAVLLVAAVCGWYGHRAQQIHRSEQQRNLYLQVGRQGALNLTTINYTEVDTDIQRVLDSSTGSFHDDFQKRSPALAEFVKKAQSKTEGTITESGIESISGDSARVLVAVSVKVANIGAADQALRHWRMRIDVQKDGDTIKVSNVGFVV